MIRSIVFTCMLTALSTALLAQRGAEVLLPLHTNPVLQQQPFAQPQQVGLGKKAATGNFPLIDRFTYPGTELNDSLWELKLVKKEGQTAVLNALDENNQPYRNNDNSYGETDVMLSRNFALNQAASVYLSFTYSTGPNWQATDSLVVEISTSSGNFTTLWRDPATPQTRTSIRININTNALDQNNTQLRFRYFTNASATNTYGIVLHEVTLAAKLPNPWAETFTQVTNDSFPLPQNWQSAPGKIYTRGNFPEGANAFVFNAYSDSNQVYNNANGSIGFADTLTSIAMSMFQFQPNDSVFLSFVYQSLPNANNNDSLVLELLNNTGQWIRVWQTGANAPNPTRFIRQVNIGRFRHDFFQFRLINKCTYQEADSLQFLATRFQLGVKKRLPFIDDFSKTNLFPDKQNWTNRYVFINNDFAIRPPSVNVATFDGLDERGNPYGVGRGYLDTLTSIPIDLSGLVRTDSVYLSFWVQPAGLGDRPNPADSIVVEFKLPSFSTNSWQTVWNGTAATFTSNAFTPVYVIVDSLYLHDDFQFRFKNIGSRTGNINIWNIDYVRLDRGRRPNDGFFDVALSNTPPALLTPYTSMPRNHFLSNPAAFTNTQQKMVVKLNTANDFPINYGRVTFNPDQVRIDSFGNTLGFVAAQSDTLVNLLSSFSLSGTFAGDSQTVKARYYTNLNNNVDNIPTNDTFTINTYFSNFFAYDDGTAEAGYGLENEPGSVALGYTLQVPDTLFGLSMFFNQSSVDVSTLPFNLMIWSAIGTGPGGTGETVLKRILVSRPIYTNQRNGFYYYKLPEPIAMPAGKFYIGWEQSSIFNLNMGFDRNYQLNGVFAKNPEMWYKVDNIQVWQQTAFTGALMMRPLIGKWLNPPVGVSELDASMQTSWEPSLYPNPASEILYIEPNTTSPYSVQVFNTMGQSLMMVNDSPKRLSLNGLASGMYWVTLTNTHSGSQQTKKVFIHSSF
ncbi:MAG: T9SS type A sorting domain-containing protein [Bacteroidia bacterium]|nr:T9SS type A sorting domain-containing protein [Bacteroidia bacterium]